MVYPFFTFSHGHTPDTNTKQKKAMQQGDEDGEFHDLNPLFWVESFCHHTRVEEALEEMQKMSIVSLEQQQLDIFDPEAYMKREMRERFATQLHTEVARFFLCNCTHLITDKEQMPILLSNLVNASQWTLVETVLIAVFDRSEPLFPAPLHAHVAVDMDEFQPEDFAAVRTFMEVGEIHFTFAANCHETLIFGYPELACFSENVCCIADMDTFTERVLSTCDRELLLRLLPAIEEHLKPEKHLNMVYALPECTPEFIFCLGTYCCSGTAGAKVEVKLQPYTGRAWFLPVADAAEVLAMARDAGEFSVAMADYVHRKLGYMPDFDIVATHGADKLLRWMYQNNALSPKDKEKIVLSFNNHKVTKMSLEAHPEIAKRQLVIAKTPQDKVGPVYHKSLRKVMKDARGRELVSQCVAKRMHHLAFCAMHLDVTAIEIMVKHGCMPFLPDTASSFFLYLTPDEVMQRVTLVRPWEQDMFFMSELGHEFYYHDEHEYSDFCFSLLHP